MDGQTIGLIYGGSVIVFVVLLITIYQAGERRR